MHHLGNGAMAVHVALACIILRQPGARRGQAGNDERSLQHGRLPRVVPHRGTLHARRKSGAGTRRLSIFPDFF